MHGWMRGHGAANDDDDEDEDEDDDNDDGEFKLTVFDSHAG